MIKKNFLLGLVVLTVIAVSLSCNKKTEEEDPEPVATCSDGIQNQGEVYIDCGGPCPACPSLTCKVDGVDWTADISSITSGFFGSVLNLQGGQSANSSSILIGYMGVQVTGNEYPLDDARYTINGVDYLMTGPGTSGKVTFSTFINEADPPQHIIEGTFYFTVKDGSGNTVNVTNGVFTNIEYSM
ncbi:MAG: hypothetical protein K9J13_12965 [Saprospiraceae bacterium]|nr:hypothetical protein [Saprospiraceae bacterium]